MEAPTYSTMDSEVMNTLFEFWSISRSLKGRSKSKLTQVVEARSKILKTANILLSKTNQESTWRKICDKQDDSITKKSKKIEHSDRLCQAFSEKLQSANQSTKIKPLTLISDILSEKRKHNILGWSSEEGTKNEEERYIVQSLFIVQVPQIKVIDLIRMLWLADYTFSLKGMAKWSESSID